MTSTQRVNRKASDQDIIRLNSVGLSLSTIGGMLGVHPTTITLRLQGLGIDPADTRRSFMEDIWNSLTQPQQEWLADRLGPQTSIKELVKDLLLESYTQERARSTLN